MKNRLRDYGFSLDDYKKAQARWEKRGFILAFGGRGRYCGMFHVSGMIGNGVWSSFRAYSPERVIDEVATLASELRKKEAVK